MDWGVVWCRGLTCLLDMTYWKCGGWKECRLRGFVRIVNPLVQSGWTYCTSDDNRSIVFRQENQKRVSRWFLRISKYWDIIKQCWRKRSKLEIKFFSSNISQSAWTYIYIYIIHVMYIQVPLHLCNPFTYIGFFSHRWKHAYLYAIHMCTHTDVYTNTYMNLIQAVLGTLMRRVSMLLS